MLLTLAEKHILSICSCLNAADLLSVSTVCKQLETLTSSPLLWKAIFESSRDKLITLTPPIPKSIGTIFNASPYDNNGKDASEDNVKYWKYLCSKHQKFDSITAALEAALPSSLIHLRPAVYAEKISVTKPVHIIGLGGISKVVLENKPDSGIIEIDTSETIGESEPTTEPSSATPVNPSHVISIRNCTLRQKSPTDSEEICVQVLSGTALIEECVLICKGFSCISIETGTALIRRNTITSSGVGITLLECGSMTIIEDNRIVAKGYGVEVTRTNPVIRNNNITGAETGVSLTECIGTVINNTVFNTTENGIQLIESNATVSNNKIHGGKRGISVYENSAGTFEANEIFDNSEENVLVTKQCTPTFKNNKIFRSKQQGVVISEDGGGVFEDNEIYENVEEGVAANGSSDLRFVNNTVRDNTHLGFNLSGGGHFEKNRISNNQGGIDVERSGKPTLLDNILVDNDKVAKELQECIKQGGCTFSVTGANFTPQRWWLCDTCDKGGSTGCCAACLNVCHKGHKLIPKFSKFYCDCGEGNCGLMPKSKKKKVLKKQH